MPEMTEPQSLRMEAHLIGTLMLERGAIEKVKTVLSEDAPYLEHHQWLYSACLELQRESKPITATSVGAKLGSKKLKELGNQKALLDLIDATPHGIDVKGYAAEIQECHLRRQLAKRGRLISEMACDTDRPLKEVFGRSEKAVFDITQSQHKGRGFEGFADLSAELFAEIEDRADRGLPLGVPSGCPELDRETNGFQSAQSIYLIANPGCGKTSWACQTAEHIAYVENKPIAYFSLEMSKKQLWHRRIAAKARVSSTKIKAGKLTEPEIRRVCESISELNASNNFLVEDTRGLTMDEIASQLRSLQADYGDLAAAFIDHIHLIDRGNKSEYEGVSDIAKRIMDITQELQIPLIALCQLNQTVGNRADKRPTPFDIKAGSVINQCADIILGLYRDELYNPDTQDRGIAELSINKHRDGAMRIGQNAIRLYFEPEFTTFRNSSPRLY